MKTTLQLQGNPVIQLNKYVLSFVYARRDIKGVYGKVLYFKTQAYNLIMEERDIQKIKNKTVLKRAKIQSNKLPLQL